MLQICTEAVIRSALPGEFMEASEEVFLEDMVCDPELVTTVTAAAESVWEFKTKVEAEGDVGLGDGAYCSKEEDGHESADTGSTAHHYNMEEKVVFFHARVSALTRGGVRRGTHKICWRHAVPFRSVCCQCSARLPGSSAPALYSSSRVGNGSGRCFTWCKPGLWQQQAY